MKSKTIFIIFRSILLGSSPFFLLQKQLNCFTCGYSTLISLPIPINKIKTEDILQYKYKNKTSIMNVSRDFSNDFWREKKNKIKGKDRIFAITKYIKLMFFY